MPLSGLSRSSVIALSIIAIVATSLSLVSYQYAYYNAKKIADLATNEIRTNSGTKAHDISKIIENKFHEVTSVLKTLATAPAIHNEEHPRAEDIITIRQESTKEITDGYFWLDKDGKMIWSSKFAGDPASYEKYKGTDLSQQPYFSEPKKTGTAFFSSIIETQEAPKVYVSMPIIDKQQKDDGRTEDVFKGVVATGIKTDTIAEIVKADVSQAFESQIVLLDKSGTIMYSANQSSIGRDVLSPDYRSYIYSLTAAESRGAIDTLLSDLSEAKAGSQDMKFQDTVYTISYSPVKIGESNLLMFYVLSPHTLTTEVSLLIDEQRNISAIIIATISIVAVGIGILIISWNRRLQSAVEERTKELKQANELLLNHDKMQQEFINIAAHELRTPVQPLLAAAEMLEDQMGAGTKNMTISTPEVEMIIRNAKRLARLSYDILEVSRIESNSLKIYKERVNLQEKIEHIISDVKGFIEEHKQLEIIFESKVLDPIIVQADKTRLFQVLSNLLHNAIKFTKRGTIKVILDKNETEAIVTVKDTGKGIDPEVMPRLFSKFTSKSESGTGLGLYISKNIIEAHGGTIYAENNQDGPGATFRFTLPMKIVDDMKKEQSKEENYKHERSA